MSEVLVSQGDTTGRAVAPVLLAVVLAVIGGGLVLGSTMGGEGVLAAIGAAVLLLAAAAGWYAAKRVRVVARLDPGVLDVPHRTFYLASDVPCRFRRVVKRGPTSVQHASARMVLQEWVRYTVGTDTRTATHEVAQIPLQATPSSDGQQVIVDLVLAIPAMPPTFEASNNKVQWRLEVHLTFPDGFEEDSVFPLWVVPASQGSIG